MAKFRYVKGKITETVEGDYNIYAKGNINNISATKFSQTGNEEGVEYGECQPKERDFGNDFIPIVSIAYNLVETKIKYDYSGFDLKKNYKKESTKLSSHLDSNLMNQPIDIIKLFKDEVIVPFRVKKSKFES